MTEADSLERLRGKPDPGVVPRDLVPGDRPVRMRGFYRALKRGEPWAVEIDKKTGFDRMLALYCYRVDFMEIMQSNFLLERVGKEDTWKGGHFVVPIRMPLFGGVDEVHERKDDGPKRPLLELLFRVGRWLRGVLPHGGPSGD